MEISGKIIAVLPMATGEGKNGIWRSQDYVLETSDQYPKKYVSIYSTIKLINFQWLSTTL